MAVGFALVCSGCARETATAPAPAAPADAAEPGEGSVRMASGRTAGQAAAETDAALKARHEGQQTASRRRRPRLHAQFLSLEAPMKPGERLLIEATGPVAVLPNFEETLRVQGEAAAMTRERASSARVVLAQGEGGGRTLRIEFTSPGDKSDFSSFNVALPRGVALEIRTGRAPVTVGDAAASVTISSESGEIVASNIDGAVTATTSNGGIQMTGISGPVIARTANAPIVLDRVDGSVDALTSNASVSVTLTDRSAGPVRIETSNAAVRLMLTPAFRGALSASSDGGVVAQRPGAQPTGAEEPFRTFRRSFGEGPESTVATSGGVITLVGPF